MGFGSSPLIVNDTIANDGSVDTLRDTLKPALLINDRTQNWGAGYAQSSSDYDHIGIILESWSDTKIVLGGFSSLLGNAANPGQYAINVGDSITVTVYGPNEIGITSYDTIVI